MPSLRSTLSLAFACTLLASLPHVVHAQVGEPINLPEFVVTGKDNIHIPGGVKQSPSRPATLTSKALDSLNPVEKQPIPSIPANRFAIPRRTFSSMPGYLDATFGMYLTPRVEAGYSLETKGYRLDFAGHGEASDGWVDNASYMNIGFDVLSTYVAPEKFIFFGGSTTEVDANFNTRSYNLYALPSAPSRTSTQGGASLMVDGKSDDLSYRAGASYSLNSVTTSGMADASGAMLRGFLFAEQRYSGIDVSALVDLQVPSFNSETYPFLEASARMWINGSLGRIYVGAGFQTAESTTGATHGGVLLLAKADLFLSEKLTLQADGRSGLRSNTFSHFIGANQFVGTSFIIAPSYDVFDVRGTVIFHPSLSWTASAGLRLRNTDRDIQWVGDSTGTFIPTLATITTLQVPADVRWLLSGADAITGEVLFTFADVTDAKQQTYTPAARVTVSYDRQWSSALYSTISVLYVGDRWADVANTVQLSGFVDLRASIEYSISDAMTIKAQVQNLLGSSIVVWNGYPERGMFIAGGLNWKF